MANTRRLSTLPKGCRHDCYQDGRYQDLSSKSEPETPLRCIADQGSSSTADNTYQNGDEAPNGLHARDQDSSDQADNNPNKEATDEAGNFHRTTQPLRRPIGQGRLAVKVPENTFCGSHP